MYILRIKNLPRARIAGIAIECIRLLTEYGSESTFGIDFDLDELPEMYEAPDQEKEKEKEKEP